ncbi:uncharacterized protein LOC113005541 [Solenopsis invicta]|uniref:uncharacterized protein LOC113005541 n=1 Tax=Solenopsis invicta TaxID=13686 RepID=UPI00193E95D9|nr:uncharacterized protein LOC113005541 [Solenopsis invicta]
MEQYAIVEFSDGLQMIPSCWITEDKKHEYWPPFSSNKKFRKSIQKCISKMENWPLHEIKKLWATADTYHKGMKKLKKVEFISDVNSESEDYEISKKERKNRAKTIMSSEESFNEDEKCVRLPSYPKLPQRKNLTYSENKTKTYKTTYKSKNILKQMDCENNNTQAINVSRHSNIEKVNTGKKFIRTHASHTHISHTRTHTAVSCSNNQIIRMDAFRTPDGTSTGCP